MKKQARIKKLMIICLMALCLLPLMTTTPALAQTDCPANPGEGIPSTHEVEETANFCIYYEEDNVLLTQTVIDNTAVYVEEVYELFDITYAFRAPYVHNGFTKMYMHIVENDGACNGAVNDTNAFTVFSGCRDSANVGADIEPVWEQVTAHEIFHRVQIGYDNFSEDGDGLDALWFYEGSARMIQDVLSTADDNWANWANVGYSFISEAQDYLVNTDEDVTSSGMRYESALWWKYFTEQYGSTASEPGLGIDALVQLWESADTFDDVAAVNNALSALGAGTTFDNAFQDFAAAVYAKDLTGAPGEYNFIDEEHAGSPGSYGPPTINQGGAVPSVSVANSFGWTNISIDRYGAVYYRAEIDHTDCPVVTASFNQDSGSTEFYHIITEDNGDYVDIRTGNGSSWTQSFIADDISHIVAVAGSGSLNTQVDIEFSCAVPFIDVVMPNEQATAYVGPAAGPGKFLAQVFVYAGIDAPVVAGLSATDFEVEVNGVDAAVTAGGFIQEQYWLLVQAPNQGADGLYDLEVALEDGGGVAIASDTNANSINYSPDNVDYAVVIDKSGSMASNDKMQAAIDAAVMYVDMTRNFDGLSVIPYDGDVDLTEVFPMQDVDFAARGDAKSNYIENLVPAGLTSIGDGMNEAANQAAASPTGNTTCSFILLSDGIETEGDYWWQVQADVVASGCPVTTIAFGSESDEDLMEDIATQTGGAFFYNDVYVSNNTRAKANSVTRNEMFLDLADNYALALSEATNRDRIMNERGVISTSQPENTHTVIIDKTTTEAMFALDWVIVEDPEMEMVLITPSGEEITREERPYDFVEVFKYGHLGWVIDNPEPGEWTILVRDPNQIGFVTEYQVMVSGKTGINAELLMPNQLFRSAYIGQRVPIYAVVSAGSPIPNVNLVAIVTAPDGTETRVELFDDGLHDDGEAGDGVYGNWYTLTNQTIFVKNTEGGQDIDNTQNEGTYRVKLRVRHPEFEREEHSAFTVVNDGFDANNNNLPEWYEWEYGITNPNADHDLDGLNAYDEFQFGTDPFNSDTDGGGENDGSEIINGQNPLEPQDDMIEKPDFIRITPGNGEVLVTYDTKDYDEMYLYRVESDSVTVPVTATYTLINEALPLSGRFIDMDVKNGETYWYKLMGVGEVDSGKRSDSAMSRHGTAIIDSVMAAPSEDTEIPEGEILINRGEAMTADTTVQLSFTPKFESDETFDDIKQVRLSETADMSQAAWQTFEREVPYTLSAAPGETAQVFAQFQDAAGNESLLTVDSIMVEAEVPLSVTLNEQATAVDGHTVAVIGFMLLMVASIILLPSRKTH